MKKLLILLLLSTFTTTMNAKELPKETNDPCKKQQFYIANCSKANTLKVVDSQCEKGMLSINNNMALTQNFINFSVDHTTDSSEIQCKIQLVLGSKGQKVGSYTVNIDANYDTSKNLCQLQTGTVSTDANSSKKFNYYEQETVNGFTKYLFGICEAGNLKKCKCPKI